MSKDLTIIIPAAGTGRRMKSYGPKSLIDISPADTIISRQLRILKNQYPRAEIIVVVGFQADKLIKILPEWVKVIENELYEESNIVRSIGMALRAIKNNKVLIVYGDLVFSENIFDNLNFNKSFVLMDSTKQINNQEIGLVCVNDEVKNFSYSLDPKWCQISYLTGDELKAFRRISAEREKRKLDTFEVFNSIIDMGGRFKAIEQKEIKIVEVDCYKDIAIARGIL